MQMLIILSLCATALAPLTSPYTVSMRLFLLLSKLQILGAYQKNFPAFTCDCLNINTVTHTTPARQRLDKHCLKAGIIQEAGKKHLLGNGQQWDIICLVTVSHRYVFNKRLPRICEVEPLEAVISTRLARGCNKRAVCQKN
jgi:hypothetical protein